MEQPVSEPPVVPFEEELAAARQVYQAAKTVIQEAMDDTRLGRAINVDAVRTVVADMTDSVFRNPDALSSLSRLKRFDEYTFYHSVNTSLLAMSMGKSLGFDRSMLHLAGVGTLLHDIGKTKIPLEVLNKPGRFEAHEMEIMKQHVLRGVEVLASTTGLGDSYVQPALEHHERVNGAGYPHRRAQKDISQFGLITAIVDIYDAMTSDRCYHKGQPAHQALQFLYRLSLEGHLDPTLVQRFIQIVGVYPVGSVVELNTGETMRRLWRRWYSSRRVRGIHYSLVHKNRISRSKGNRRIGASRPFSPLNKPVLTRPSISTRKRHRHPHRRTTLLI
jgi:putative nucleotidyltransferase with HDIG domain